MSIFFYHVFLIFSVDFTEACDYRSDLAMRIHNSGRQEQEWYLRERQAPWQRRQTRTATRRQIDSGRRQLFLQHHQPHALWRRETTAAAD